MVNPTLFTWFVAVIAGAVVLQAIVLLVMGIGAAKTLKKVQQLTDKAEVHLLPLMATSREVLADAAPKIKVMAENIRTISDNLAHVSNTVRQQSQHVNTVVGDVVSRSQRQAVRVDGIVSSTLDTVSQWKTAVTNGVEMPLRKIIGMANGFKAGIDSLLRRRTSAAPGAIAEQEYETSARYPRVVR